MLLLIPAEQKKSETKWTLRVSAAPVAWYWIFQSSSVRPFWVCLVCYRWVATTACCFRGLRAGILPDYHAILASSLLGLQLPTQLSQAYLQNPGHRPAKLAKSSNNSARTTIQQSLGLFLGGGCGVLGVSFLCLPYCMDPLVILMTLTTNRSHP